MLAAAGLGLAACASTITAKDIAESVAPGSRESTTYFVIVQETKGAVWVVSGSYWPGSKEYRTAPKQEIGAGAAEKISVTLRSGLSDKSAKSLAEWDPAAASAWALSFARALDRLARQIFSSDAPRSAITLVASDADAALNELFESKVEGNAFELRFTMPVDRLGSEAYRDSVASDVIAHEYHHAMTRIASPSTDDAADREALVEATAQIFATCAQFSTVGFGSRIGQSTTFNGRSGGVVTDEELAYLIGGAPAADVDSQRDAMGRLFANTVWTSIVGPEWFAEADSPGGRRFMDICTKENLASADAIIPLLRQLASDGVDAPAFPQWTSELQADLKRRYEAVRSGRGELR